MRAALHPLLLVMCLSAVSAVNTPATPTNSTPLQFRRCRLRLRRRQRKGSDDRGDRASGEGVAALCRRHPEMSPCQNARNACRSSGGRVYAADGREVTQADEAEYDKKVMRVRIGP